MNQREDPSQTPEVFHVVIAGGGVAGLEAAFALRELMGDRVGLTLLAAGQDFVYRPLAIGEPFNRSHAKRYPLSALAAEAGAEVVNDSLAEVDAERREVRTLGGQTLAYDALLVGVGATLEPPPGHVTGFDDARSDELLHGLVQDIEEGYLRRLAIIVPAPMPWPFPAYELALMASERAWDMQVDLDVTLCTPEPTPLSIFGEEASRALSNLLSERRIEVITSAYCEVPEAKKVVVHPGDRTLEADRIVMFPRLRGPGLPGLPQDGMGFIPIDEYGQVRGVQRVWAAGDATDFPIKQGGIAAQVADTAARSIAAEAGLTMDQRPFVPVVEGVLMTGGTPRYLRGRPTSPDSPGESVFTEVMRGSAPPKIAARYLGPHLPDQGPATVGASS
jgi:sulfide:quinone oxidoreductase